MAQPVVRPDERKELARLSERELRAAVPPPPPPPSPPHLPEAVVAIEITPQMLAAMQEEARGALHAAIAAAKPPPQKAAVASGEDLMAALVAALQMSNNVAIELRKVSVALGETVLELARKLEESQAEALQQASAAAAAHEATALLSAQVRSPSCDVRVLK